MFDCSKTSIVFNPNSKIRGLQPFYYRLRKCNTNLTGNTPADQYQKLKLIQNTVRVPSSLYTSNLGPLTAYQQHTLPTKVCWNQMSDRAVPSVQKATVPTGIGNSLNRRHSSVTSSKPGGQTPGGIGCDIKHNSYDRYLNRLKGKRPLKRGVILPTFGLPIYFNPAFPIYGGKTTKTSIVSGCNTVANCTLSNSEQNAQIYNNPNFHSEPTCITTEQDIPDSCGYCGSKTNDEILILNAQAYGKECIWKLDPLNNSLYAL